MAKTSMKIATAALASIALASAIATTTANNNDHQKHKSSGTELVVSDKYKTKAVYPHYKEGDVLPKNNFPH